MVGNVASSEIGLRLVDARGELGAERIARLFARASVPEGLLALAPPSAPLEPEGLAKAFVPDSEEGRLAAAACSVAGVPVAVDVTGGAIALVVTHGGSSPKPAPVARVAPVPHGATPQQQAQNLAAWLARYSR